MTAKRKPRGALARLEVLEDRHALRVEQIEAEKEAQTGAALSRLQDSTLSDLEAFTRAQDEGGPAWDAVRKAGAALEGPLSTHPAKENAEAWALALEDLPDGQPYPLPADPSSFAAYFHEEAGRCTDLLTHLEACEDLPAGVAREAGQAVARYARAVWLFDAALCEVLAGQP